MEETPRRLRENTREKLTLHVCHGKKCMRRGAAELAGALSQGFAEQGFAATVTRHECFDLCKQGCNVLLELPGHEQRIYTGLHPKQADAFAEHIADELRADARETGALEADTREAERAVSG